MKQTTEIRMYVKYAFYKNGRLELDTAILRPIFRFSKSNLIKSIELHDIIMFSETIINKKLDLEMTLSIDYNSSLQKIPLDARGKSHFEKLIYIANKTELDKILSEISIHMLDSKSAIILIDEKHSKTDENLKDEFLLSLESITGEYLSNTLQSISDSMSGKEKRKSFQFVDIFLEFLESGRFTQNSDWMNRENVLNDWNSLAKDDKADET